ncbi:type I-E CRISPR-associated protein Cse1/CasA [Streptomyces sp. NPDC127574]|uniref:type I-E CRISPR-associated protein Cse1/CasA n=1 Tax=Streptomyces sp. NPDC127574 TaxID=3345401 RepID=UPI003630829C
MTESEPPGADGSTISFDLTDQPWIGVVRDDGSQDDLSLRQIFAQASRVRRIVADLPTQEFALLRLLLAVSHDALEGPRDLDHWEDLRSDPDCFSPVAAYLDEHRQRLDLLHPQSPFFQTAGLRTVKDEVFSLNRIVADVPNGEPFFAARMPSVERLSFAEAARWVVHAHAFDTSGIKTGTVGDSRVKGGKVYPRGTGWAGALGGDFAEGDTLRETLLLNLIAFDTDELEVDADDRPAWRRDPSGPDSIPRSASGPVDLYTWQSRRLRLHFDEDGVHGVVLGYGDPLAARNMQRREPMTSWRRSPAQEKKLGTSPVYLPREHDPARSVWRGLQSLVADRTEASQNQEAAAYLRPRVLDWIARLVSAGQLERNYLVRARTVGAVYGTQQSVIDDIVDDHLAMPVVLLHERERTHARQAVGAAEDADRAMRAVGDLAADLARAAGRNEDGLKETARTGGFDLLEEPFRRWLVSMVDTEDPFAQREVWQHEVWRLLTQFGTGLVDAAGAAAWQGRTVTSPKGTHWLNAGLADTWFRARLAKALGMTATRTAVSGAPAAAEPAVPGPRPAPDRPPALAPTRSCDPDVHG